MLGKLTRAVLDRILLNVKIRRNQGVRVLLFLAVALVGCGAEELASGPLDVDGIDVSEDQSPLPDLQGEDTISNGPPCENDSDCANVFSLLGVCEQVQCVSENEGPGICHRLNSKKGKPCDDANPCSLVSLCDGLGICEAATLVSCPARRCRDSLGCDPASGQCLYQTMADGSECSDLNPCTENDICLGGYCSGAYQDQFEGCACTRDKDCPKASNLCDGELSCQEGQCVVVYVNGIQCSEQPKNSCQESVCDPENGQCGMVWKKDGATCDDSNPCTQNESCAGGVCSGGKNQCSCNKNTDCASFEDGDLCNGTLYCDLSVTPGLCRVDPETMTLCVESETSCLGNYCQPSTGLCKLEAFSDGGKCDDGNACTLGDQCQKGQCVPVVTALCGAPQSCGDSSCSNECWSVPECDPAAGCLEFPVDGPCDDGLPCHSGDQCVGGLCVPGAESLLCDDGSSCTTDSCDDAAGGCVHVPDSVLCDDGYECTVDKCDSSLSGGNPSGCSYESNSKLCNDSNPCTTGICVAHSGCQFVFNSAPCEDGDACTDGDKCKSGKCKPGDKVCPCNDDANCTVVGGGECAGVWHCIANQCVLESAAKKPCDASNLGPCIVSFCDTASGTCKVETLPNGSTCDDGDACVLGENCQDGTCIGGAKLTCDDGNLCTDDSCDLEAGCVSVNNVLPCDDGDSCTGDDHCALGACQASTSICECKADSDCIQPFDLCAGQVRCIDNSCQLDPGTVVVCEPVGACQSAVCESASGLCIVTVKPDQTPCTDKNACSGGDYCFDGSCLTKSTLNCDDGNSCTLDTCNPESGCVHAATEGGCNDGNSCTSNEQCELGQCVATVNLCVENCDNGKDDDGDGDVDCLDSDCIDTGQCGLCANTPFIQCGDKATPGTLFDESPTQLAFTACGGSVDPNRSYRFVTNQSGNVSITLAQGNGSFGLWVHSSKEDQSCDIGACKAEGEELDFVASAGHLYHVVVEKLAKGGPSNFSLNVTCNSGCKPDCSSNDCGPDGCGGSCGDCNDGNPCSVNSCEFGLCTAVSIPGCCFADSDCDAGNGCSQGQCVDGACQFSEIQGCCQESGDCNDDIACTSDNCVDGVCTYEVLEGCCASDTECADTLSCTDDICVTGSCYHLWTPGCCQADGDCQNASLCLTGQCVEKNCVFQEKPGCCELASDCDDGNKCTLDGCNAQSMSCVNTAISGCCHIADDCDGDGDPCTQAQCIGSSCVQKGKADCCYDDSHCSSAFLCSKTSCKANVCISQKISGCCISNNDCEDGVGCTLDLCVSNQCQHFPVAGCCQNGADCDDSNVCTQNLCIASKCVFPTIEKCCQSDVECQSEQPCEVGFCVDGGCEFQAKPECCENESWCSSGSCIAASCPAGSCQYANKNNCCTQDSQCDVGNPCLQSQCVDGNCSVEAKEGCCLVNDDCPVPKSPCDSYVCSFNKCLSQPVAGCCIQNDDCPASNDPCQLVQCLGHVCAATQSPGCCQNNEDCSSQSEPCADAICADGSCTSAPKAGCCTNDSDCPAAEESCMHALCESGSCTVQTTLGCCNQDSDCASSNGDLCALTECVLGQCTTIGNKPGCCSKNGDCPVLAMSCKQSECVAQQCVAVQVPECCVLDSDCAPASDSCIESICTQGKCSVSPVSHCCETSEDCPDDGNPCTSAACLNESCAAMWIADCCNSDDQCEPSSSQACTEETCVANQCTESKASGCCSSDSECPDDGDPCSTETCVNSVCLAVPVPGCCSADEQCPEEPGPCTINECVNGQCILVAFDDCCVSSLDCSSPSDPCVSSLCDNGQCDIKVASECAQGACFYTKFDSPPENWTVKQGLSGIAEFDESSELLMLHLPAGFTSDLVVVESPTVWLQGSSSARFKFRTDIDVGDCSSARASFWVVPEEGAVKQLWSVCGGTFDWKDVVLDLSGWTSQKITLRFVLERPYNGQGGKLRIDELAISGDCSLSCTADCPTGDPCVESVCVDGFCSGQEIPSCCVSKAACSDGDPCTQDACTPDQGCVWTPWMGCLQGACVSTAFETGLEAGWTADNSFSVESDNTIGPSNYLYAEASAEVPTQEAQLNLPQVVIAGPSSLRFILKHNLGSECQNGTLTVIVAEQEISVPCVQSSDWQPTHIQLPALLQAPLNVSLRFSATNETAWVALDDIRLVGSCNVVECADAADCDDANPCTVDACDGGFQCVHLIKASCCATDADCPPVSTQCLQAKCLEGVCNEMPISGCLSGSCRYENFSNGLPTGWKNLDQGSNSDLQWEVSKTQGYDASASLYGHSLLQPSGPGKVARIQTAPVAVNAIDVEMSFIYKQLQIEPGCDRGALQVWVDDLLLWQSCESQMQWKLHSLSLAPWIGQVVRPELRIRGDLAGNSAVEAWLDEFRVTGDCKAVDCIVHADCADDNVCTDELCLGFSCHYPTNQVPCDDGDACTEGDSCVLGQCQSSPLICDDGESCTDDSCDFALGCVFQPNLNPCDDGKPCTAGDTCTGGVCFGNPILCKDFNGCTVDGCTPGAGCLFENKPFAAACDDDGAEYGMCWDGSCVNWSSKLSEVPGFAANDTRAFGVTTRQTPTPIRVAGSYSPDGKRVAAMFRIDQKDLSLHLVQQENDFSALYGIDADIAVGENGSVVAAGNDGAVPQLDVAAGLNLYAIASSGSTFFVGGDGSSVGPSYSTLRRCKRVGGGWQTCHDMIVSRSPDQCEQQVPFHIRDIWPLSAQKLLVAGMSYENPDNPVARIASWDGNTFSDCPGNGVYNGELYYSPSVSSLNLAVNKKGANQPEALLALGAAGASSIWAGGTGGMLYYFDGKQWLSVNPSVWTATKSWNSFHTVRGIYATATDVHVVGDGVGVKSIGCRDSFYLHGSAENGSWRFDRLLYFETAASDCGSSPFTYAGLQDIAVDELTGDLYIVGWGPDSTMNPLKRRGLILRLQKP